MQESEAGAAEPKEGKGSETDNIKPNKKWQVE
jgi:hypothetical protein